MQYVPPVRRVKQLNVAPAVKEVSVVADAGANPHAPVRLLLRSAPRKILMSSDAWPRLLQLL